MHQCGSDSEPKEYDSDDEENEVDSDVEELPVVHRSLSESSEGKLWQEESSSEEEDLSWEDDDCYDYESESELGDAPFQVCF
jgi:hypothetical protein